MTRFEKKNLLRVKLESIFRRMRNGEPLNEDERYAKSAFRGKGTVVEDKRAKSTKEELDAAFEE